jgi:hypothetical protein
MPPPKLFGADLRGQTPQAGHAEDLLPGTGHWTWRPHSPELWDRMVRDLRAGKEKRRPAVETNYRPSRVRQKVLLCFCAPDFFGTHLGRSGLKYFAVDFDQLAARGGVEIRLGKDFSASLSLGGARLDLRDVRAVLWDPPPWMIYCSDPSTDPRGRSGRELQIRRWSQLLRDLPGLLPPETVWLPSHPLNGSAHWQNRIAELEAARRVGLAVPETACTNDPKAALSFVERCGGRALFRDFSLQPFGGPLEWVTTKQARACAPRLRLAPSVLMQAVEKEYDVRAVVVGRRVFAVRIDSQASALPQARLDWRHNDFAHTPHARMRLPRTTERRMLRLMKELGLLWGSFDLVKGRDGRLYFLEVNRPGSTGWLKPFVGLDVPAELLAYLKSVFSS